MHRYLRSALGTSRALRNVREALAQLTDDGEARRALRPAPDVDDIGAPGELGTMTRAQCYQLLAEASLGRFAYIARADTPDIVPVNYVLDGEDLLIHSGPGPKLQAAERADRVAFEVDVIDPITRSGRSVVVIGRSSRIPAAEQWQRWQPQSVPWATGPRHAVIRIRPTRVTGRQLS